jgi:hypothetical protein
MHQPPLAQLLRHYFIKQYFMSGRGDNNKHGSAGRGSSNQSNQPFVGDGEKQPRSDHNKKHTGGESSVKQQKSGGTDVDRNTAVATEKIKPLRTDERTFDVLVDEVPYMIKAAPFSFNEEVRYYVTVNGGTEHVFTWDSELGRLRAIDDQSSILPDSLEEAISEKLEAYK